MSVSVARCPSTSQVRVCWPVGSGAAGHVAGVVVGVGAGGGAGVVAPAPAVEAVWLVGWPAAG